MLQDYATLQAERRPDATALVLGESRMSFAELEMASNRMARALRRAGCERGDRVALLLPKTPDAIVGLLATLKAGCMYVPVDVATPPPRIARIVAASAPRVVIVAETTASLLDELLALGCVGGETAIVAVQAGDVSGERFSASLTSAEWSELSAEPLERTGSEEDGAHILFTSGSTGTPKGVVITHRNVMTFVEWAVEYFGMSQGDRISGHPPLHFDLSTFDIYGALRSGAELCLVPAALNAVPNRLAEFIRANQLTQWFSVPTAMTFMAKLDAVRQGDFPTLRRVLWCGEVLPTPTLRHWMQRLPHVQFTNLYGPTETTIASSYYTVPACPASDTDAVPIGAACGGEEILVCDAELKPVAPGEIGDIYIGGAGLSPGYWKDSDQTQAVFVPDPRHDSAPGARIYRTGDLGRTGEDGLVYFLGRADSQIKSRGYRIELGEIEVALNALAGLKESAVVGVDGGDGDGVTICCAFVPADGSEMTEKDVRTALRATLPSYMLPARWLSLDVLPKNANAKIDRPRLRELFRLEAIPAAGGGR